MRMATFNVENLFERPLIMNLKDWNAGRKVLTDYSRLNDLISQEVHSQANKGRMLCIISQYKSLIANEESTYLRLGVVRGQFIKNTQPPSVAANGRADRIG